MKLVFTSELIPGTYYYYQSQMIVNNQIIYHIHEEKVLVLSTNLNCVTYQRMDGVIITSRAENLVFFAEN